jgi:hypothetical protein
MPYSRIDVGHVTDPIRRKVLHHADLLLGDLYSIFLFDPPEDSNGGRGNFTIALVLSCIIDGLATEVVAATRVIEKQEPRFKHLVREILPWQSQRRPWVESGTAACVIYLEIRNALTHELGKDKITSARPAGWDEPAVHKWGPNRKLTVDELDSRPDWPKEWPILWVGENATGAPRYEMSSAAMYWAVKKLVRDEAAK